MRKSTLYIKLSLLALVLGLWTNVSAQSITEVESITCPGKTDGQLSFTTSAGAVNTSYSWTNSSATVVSTDITAKKLKADTYTLTVIGTDAGVYTYVLKDPTQISNVINPTPNTKWGALPSDCNGALNIVTTGGTGQISYIIYDVLSRETFTTNSITNRPPGSYTITTTDENGCFIKETAIIADNSESTLTTVPASDTTYVCYKKTAGSTVIPSSKDIYPVYAKFSGRTNLGKDTTATDSAIYYVLDSTVVSGTIYAATYIDSIAYWSIPVTNNIDTLMFLSKTFITSTSSAGVYSNLLILKKSNLNFSFTANISVLQPDSSFITRTIIDTLITGSSTSLAVSNLEPGFYTAYFWNSKAPNPEGKRGVWDIVGPENPITINYTQTDVKCFGYKTGAITAEAMGSWHDYPTPFSSLVISGNGYSQTVTNVNSISSPNTLGAGIYTITATDIHNCSSKQTIEIAQPDDTIRIVFDNESVTTCTNGTNATVSVKRVDGAATPIKSYTWNTLQTTQSISNVGIGKYIVTIIDANDCPATDSTFVLPTERVLNIVWDPIINTYCPLSADGALSIRGVTGAEYPVEYEWSNGDSTQTIENLTVGKYVVKITDSYGCSATDSVEVESKSNACFFNIITPNGDGYNDYFDLSGLTKDVKLDCKIFNEAGNLVATLSETNPKWDALDESKPPTGTASTYTAFVKITKDGKTIAEFGESFSVIYTK